MAFLTIKTIRGVAYRYLQHSYRDGKRVRTRTKCLGRADGNGRRYNPDFDPVLLQQYYDREMGRALREDDALRKQLEQEPQKEHFSQERFLQETQNAPAPETATPEATDAKD